MTRFKITYALNGRAMMKIYMTESEGEAMEQFESYCYGLDDAGYDVEFLSINEI